MKLLRSSLISIGLGIAYLYIGLSALFGREDIRSTLSFTPFEIVDTSLYVIFFGIATLISLAGLYLILTTIKEVILQ